MSAVMTLGLLLSFAPACDGEDGDEQAGDTSGDGDGDPGDGDPGDGDPGDGDPGNGEGFAEAGDGDGDSGLMGCAALTTEAECLGQLGCGAVRGNLLIEDGNGAWCTEAEDQFIGCASSTELCPMLSKTLCSDDAIWRTTGCVPGNLTVCEAPGEITGTCSEGVGKT